MLRKLAWNLTPRFEEVDVSGTEHRQVKNNLISDGDRSRLDFCIELVPSDVHTLLDVGTKTAYFCRIAKERSIMAEGLDDTIRPNIEAGISVKQGDIRDIPFPDKSFDCTTAFEILEHLTYPDMVKAIAELKRVTRKWLIVSVPFEEYPIREQNHLQNFSRRKLHRALGGQVKFSYYGFRPTGGPLVIRIANRMASAIGISAYRLQMAKAGWIIAVKDCSSERDTIA